MAIDDDRFAWELDLPVAGLDRPCRYVWLSSISAGWQLIGWVLQQVDLLPLSQSLVDTAWRIEPEVFDRVLATMAAAVAEQAWQQRSTPSDATLTGVAAQLDRIADLRHLEHYGDNDPPDDLLPMLVAATPDELDGYADIARRILVEHAAAHTAALADGAGLTRAVTVGDRLPLCPHHWGPATLTHRTPRRVRDSMIRPVPPERHITVSNTICVSEAGDLVRCPRCGATHGLMLSSEAGGWAVTVRCTNGHSWPEPRLSSENLGELFARIEQEEKEETDSDSEGTGS
ncbi:hypothetical protein [Actinomadura violacea]|uniref:Uncharacterized protein n=1 Tax=Actinomadura violacea TaxID=2819934 RepID=A0ABS3RXM5_9ACTN|nr:hypothetical protein [Actinomadura violacea]MBO2461510.1 hypothetical protein [Actinomadura violacea]